MIKKKKFHRVLLFWLRHRNWLQSYQLIISMLFLWGQDSWVLLPVGLSHFELLPAQTGRCQRAKTLAFQESRFLRHHGCTSNQFTRILRSGRKSEMLLTFWRLWEGYNTPNRLDIARLLWSIVFYRFMTMYLFCCLAWVIGGRPYDK